MHRLMRSSQQQQTPYQSRSRAPRDGLVPRQDLEWQRQMVANHRRQAHEKWVAEHQAMTRFDHAASRVRADIIVNEACRLEKEHLQHQLDYARELVRQSKRGGHRTIQPGDATPPPKLGARRHPNTSHVDVSSSPTGCHSCGSPDSRSSYASPRRAPERMCACLTAPLCRQITPKYRALALLKKMFDNDKVEEALETLRETYASDHDMLEDLIYRYGPEGDDVSPNTRLRCVEEKVEECDAKWQEIGRNVKDEMRYRDSFPNVIRNLSIMRIFLEGSQSPVYGCDTTERARRDAFHQQILDQLVMEKSLFVTPQRARGH